MNKFDKADQLYEAGDFSAAFREFLRLAEEGDTSAMLRVASMYSSAEGTPYDLDEAIRWEQKSAQLGDPFAHLNLGISHRNKGDLEKARECFEVALKKGDAEAALELARIYEKTHGGIEKVRSYARLALSIGNLSESSMEEAQRLLHD